jgi:hypothetical protein
MKADVTLKAGSDEMDQHERRTDCEQMFEQIHQEIIAYRKDHDLVVELKTRIENLARSVENLTRSIWGMMGSVLLLLTGFIIWYIQTLRGL